MTSVCGRGFAGQDPAKVKSMERLVALRRNILPVSHSPLLWVAHSVLPSHHVWPEGMWVWTRNEAVHWELCPSSAPCPEAQYPLGNRGHSIFLERVLLGEFKMKVDKTKNQRPERSAVTGNWGKRQPSSTADMFSGLFALCYGGEWRLLTVSGSMQELRSGITNVLTAEFKVKQSYCWAELGTAGQVWIS